MQRFRLDFTGINVTASACVRGIMRNNDTIGFTRNWVFTAYREIISTPTYVIRCLDKIKSDE